MASNTDDSRNLQHNSLQQKKRKESSSSIESKGSRDTSEIKKVTEPDMDSMTNTSHNNKHKEANSLLIELNIKQQPTGSFLVPKESNKDKDVKKITETDVEVQEENIGSCSLQGSKDGESTNTSKSKIESVVAVKEALADDGSDRSLKSSGTESAELISETELLKKAQGNAESSENGPQPETNLPSNAIDKTQDTTVDDKCDKSMLVKTEYDCNGPDHVDDNCVPISGTLRPSSDGKDDFTKDSGSLKIDSVSNLPETTTETLSRTVGILRGRSASDEQVDKETAPRNNASIRFGKKRSFSEVCAPPKYKVHFTRMIDTEQNMNEQLHQTALKQENGNHKSDTVLAAARSNAHVAGNRMNDKSDAETMRPPRNRIQSVDCSLAETSEKSSIDIYALEELSSTGTFSSKIAESTTSGGRNIMPEKRLPSKKRKESHDLFAQRHQLRKGSYDLSVTFGDCQNNLQRTQSKGSDDNFIRIRKGSHDLSVTFEDIRRVRADSTASLIVDVLLSPRKNSSDANSSANMTALGDPADYTIEVKADIDEDDEDNSLHHTSQLDISGLDDLDADRKLKSITKNNTRAPAFPLSDNDDGCGSDGTLGILRRPSASMQTIGSGASASGPDSVKTSSGLPLTNADRSSAAASSLSARRERLESWGAMSDLSLPYGSDSALMVNLLGAWQQSDGVNVEQSPSIEQVLFLDDKAGSYPPRLLMGIRSRLNSIGSLSEASFGEVLPPLATSSNYGDMAVDVGGHIEDCVVAAMATVEDDIAALASAVENAADFCFEFDDNSQTDLLGPQVPDSAFSDVSSTNKNGKRPRSWSTSSCLSIMKQFRPLLKQRKQQKNHSDFLVQVLSKK
jgi:hypothetical protein